MDGTNIAICETNSNAVFIIDSPFTKKDHYFQAALEEARQAFNAITLDFGNHQKLERYDPPTHQTHHHHQNHPLY